MEARAAKQPFAFRSCAAVLATAILTGCGAVSPQAAPDGGMSGADAGNTGGDAASAIALTPNDLARRLSLFLWEQRPDGALLNQLYANPPATKEDVRRLVISMLQDPRARNGVRRFFHLWLRLDGLGTVKRDPVRFPEYSQALRDTMIAEAEAFALHVTFDGDGRFPTLFLAAFSFLNEQLAPLYGVSGVTGPELRQVALDPAQRAGVLTLSAVLANVKDDALPPISARGIFVMSLLCREIPPGPPNVEMVPPRPDQSARDWLSMTVGQRPECSGCHSLMDPPGLGFGNYDALGRFSTTERGFLVDASGVLSGGPNDDAVSFSGPRELATLLAGRTDVRECFASQWLKFATGNDFFEMDALRTLMADFTASGLDIRALIAAVTTTDAFLRP